MVVRGYELHLNFLTIQVSFYCVCCNIVNDIVDWFESPFDRYSTFFLKHSTIVSAPEYLIGVDRMAFVVQSYIMNNACVPFIEVIGYFPVRSA